MDKSRAYVVAESSDNVEGKDKKPPQHYSRGFHIDFVRT